MCSLNVNTSSNEMILLICIDSTSWQTYMVILSESPSFVVTVMVVFYTLYYNYGNINQNERPTVLCPKYKQFLKVVVDSEEKLLKFLNCIELKFFKHSHSTNKTIFAFNSRWFCQGILFGNAACYQGV